MDTTKRPRGRPRIHPMPNEPREKHKRPHMFVRVNLKNQTVEEAKRKYKKTETQKVIDKEKLLYNNLTKEERDTIKKLKKQKTKNKRFIKGSQEAKDHMAYLRSLRKK